MICPPNRSKEKREALREEITVHTLPCTLENGPLFYASLPLEGALGAPGTGREEAKKRLISTLWERFSAQKDPPGGGGLIEPTAGFPIRLGQSWLGKPQLFLGADRGPDISFSEYGGRLWAALSGDNSDVGIDVAGSDEFSGDYPWHRVFLSLELQHAMTLTNGEVAGGAALIWSVKEAAVKALGCAFHLVDPGEIAVYPPAGTESKGEGWHLFAVHLSARAVKCFPAAKGETLRVRSSREGDCWLSIANLSLSPADHE